MTAVNRGWYCLAECERESDNGRDQAERFRHSETENQATAHFGISFWVTQSAREILAEDVTNADSGKAGTHSCETGTDDTC